MTQSKSKIFLIGLLLIVILCGYRWWSAGATIQRSVVNNRFLLHRDTESFIFWRGESAFRNWLAVESKTNDALTYDGQDRFAYVIRCTNPLYDGNSDNIQFERVGGPNIALVWIGSHGTRICSVKFLEESVKVGIATEKKPKQELNSAIIPWHSIESESGSGRLGDYFQN